MRGGGLGSTVQVWGQSGHCPACLRQFQACIAAQMLKECDQAGMWVTSEHLKAAAPCQVVAKSVQEEGGPHYAQSCTCRAVYLQRRPRMC